MKQLIVHKPRRKQLWTKDGSKQKTRNFCFNCLRPTDSFHNSGNCRQPSCTAEGCGKKHHRLLHQQTVTAKEQHQPQTEFSGFVKANHNVTQTLLQTAVAKMLVDQDKKIPVRGLLDPGSQRSYIRKQIAESVGLRGPTELLSVSTLGGVKLAKQEECTECNLAFYGHK